AWSSATASACGRPPGRVQPRPTTIPPLTTIAPTAGLGRLSGRARSARQAAAASQRASPSVATRFAGLPRRFGCRFLGGALARDLALHRVDVEPGGPAEGPVGGLAP